MGRTTLPTVCSPLSAVVAVVYLVRMTNQRHETGGEQTEEVTHMRTKSRWLVFVFVLALVAAACTGSETEDTTTTEATTTTTTLGTTTTEAPPTTEAPETTTTEAPAPPEVAVERSLDAPLAAITVDGDASDWASVPGLATTLEPIVSMADSVENMEATIKMAHDGENIYALFTIDDDYNFNSDDLKLSAAIALLFPVDTGGPSMGADDEEGENSTGMVDIWHWEAECGVGEPSGGGAGHPQGEGKDPGNDANCNFDDEWATDAETREDDNGEGAENSLYGVWTHTNPVEDGPGVYYFEMSRPLQTGDAQDAQFTIGEPTTLALAYWDVDWSNKGWTDDSHVQSANQGWIDVNIVTMTAEEAAMERSLDAPLAAITVDGDASDWASVPGLATTLEPIVSMADSVENMEATIKMAHDGENIYALFTIDDDYNFNSDDLKLSAAIALLFPVDTGGPSMGADDEEGENSTGMVDIWHWEAECGVGEPSGGGAGHPQGEGKDPGNDANCNFDDEWATDAETREDDNGEGAENSLYGVWTHTNPVEDGPGVYYFEMSRPLQTGDAQDAQFTIGEPTTLALAYWDVDWSNKGWTDDSHVQSANQGWIEVNIG